MASSHSLTCEPFEASLSALIDGELEAPEQLPVIDHLLACGSCREFYRQARTLDGMLITRASDHAEPAPGEVWERIAKETGLGAEESSASESRVPRPWFRGPRHLTGVLQIAAGLLVAIGLGLLWPRVIHTPDSEPPGEGMVDVVLEEARGSMSDERFLELTLEVLRADRGYHRKMLEIMSVVDTMTTRPEGSSDGPTFVAGESLKRLSDDEDGLEHNSRWGGDQL